MYGNYSENNLLDICCSVYKSIPSVSFSHSNSPIKLMATRFSKFKDLLYLLLRVQ